MSSATMLSPTMLSRTSGHHGPPTLARPAPARTAPARPAVTRTSEAPLALTRRGRMVLLALTLLVVATLGMLLARPVLADPVQSPGQHGAGTSTVLVGPGDSLWDIAEAAVPDRDPRAVVHEIRLLNDLDDARIAVGAELVVPHS